MVASDSGHKRQNFVRKFEVPKELAPGEGTIMLEKQLSEILLFSLMTYFQCEQANGTLKADSLPLMTADA